MQERGFTLIEILIVIAIIGIAGSLIVLSDKSGPKRLLEGEADRLVQILTLAQEEAEVSGQVFAAVISLQGYHFERRNRAGRWEPTNDELLRPRQWPFPVSAVSVEPANLNQILRFEPDTPSPPFVLRIQAIGHQLAIQGDARGKIILQATQ